MFFQRNFMGKRWKSISDQKCVPRTAWKRKIKFLEVLGSVGQSANRSLQSGLRPGTIKTQNVIKYYKRVF